VSTVLYGKKQYLKKLLSLEHSMVTLFLAKAVPEQISLIIEIIISQRVEYEPLTITAPALRSLDPDNSTS